MFRWIRRFLFDTFTIKIVFGDTTRTAHVNKILFYSAAMVYFFLIGSAAYSAFVYPMVAERNLKKHELLYRKILLMREIRENRNAISDNTEKLKDANIAILSQVEQNDKEFLKHFSDRDLFYGMDYAFKHSGRLQATAAIPNGMPAYGIGSSGFGYRIDPFTRMWQMHTGLDINGQYGQPIRTTMAGTVIAAGYTWNLGGYGEVVAIDNGYYQVLYGHMSTVFVHVGQYVPYGYIVGLMGSTGYSTGPHVHYEVKIFDPIDPIGFLNF